MARKTGLLKHDLADALQATQRDLAEVLGVSRRTVQRLDSNLSGLGAHGHSRAARAVFSIDPALAARHAAAGNTTLEALGLVQPAPPPTSIVPPPAPVPPSPTIPTVIAAPEPLPATADSVVCAAADAMNLPPRALRPALLAAIKRAQALGLSLEAVRGWLETEEQAPSAGSPLL